MFYGIFYGQYNEGYKYNTCKLCKIWTCVVDQQYSEHYDKAPEDDPKSLKHVTLKINIVSEVCCVDGHESI
jgi:hypothetical protein